MHFSGKKILVGITGGIAAYKTSWLVRSLIKNGAEVKVVMTPASFNFVTPLTLSTLSKNKVYSNFTDENKNGTWNNHVELALWADLFIIAPLTANTLAKMASGICDNFLLAVYFSAKCKVMVAPAMDLDMYAHPTVNKNLELIEKHGVEIIPANHGELASGLIGEGRMAEPNEIFNYIAKAITVKQPLAHKTILITAGPTYEPIDPVRFIGNRSSGKMGYAIASQALNLGAKVILVSGPVALQLTHPNLSLIKVETAQEMFEVTKSHFNKCQIAILSAAVADFTPKNKFSQKVKKEMGGISSIELEETTDILKWCGKNKKNKFLVGFALETQNELANAQQKLINKNLDIIVLNSLNDKGAGFSTDTNKITLLSKNNKPKAFELMPKTKVAQAILHEIIAQL